MADFCKQCSIELFGEDFKDLSGLVEPGHHAGVLCEGCANAWVDHTGECHNDQCLKYHGKVDETSN